MSEKALRFEAALDGFDAALRRLSALPLDTLTDGELLDLVGRYDVIRGRVAALLYELTNPFARHRPGD